VIPICNLPAENKRGEGRKKEEPGGNVKGMALAERIGRKKVR
jgi:hypothetical protein